MTSLNNIFFKKYLWCKFQLHPIRKIKIRKDNLLILTYSELLWHNWEPGWVKGEIFASTKNTNSNTARKVNKVRVRYGNNWLMVLSIASINIRGGSRTGATFKMKLFVIIVNSFQPLAIITKCSILDVAAVLDPPLIILVILHYYSSFPWTSAFWKMKLLHCCYVKILFFYFSSG